MSELKPIIEQSFTQYAGAVIQSRALVDVRDCLKPSARQILYCLYTDKFLHSKPYKKTLKAVGSLARLYIHGDASAVGVLMRAGQPFAMRYPLTEIKGNAGTLMESGNWASQRYTETRLSELTSYIFKDIDKDTIKEWRDNYDDTEQYPAVLPTKGFYNIVNGTSGIAVGAASSIPQYNLRDISTALCYLIDNPDCDFEDIYCAPDFATGAILYNETDVKESMKNGIGFACKLRSVVNFDSKDRALVVTEIPYGVYTNTICGQLEEIVNGEENPGIERFNDLTGEAPLIKIYLSKKANPDKVLKYLFKNTSLQHHYGINFTMLDMGRYPRVFTWREMLQAHIDHEKEVYLRGYNFDLKKIKDRLHIIEGLLKAISMIDEVVKTIRSSSDSKSANIALQKLLSIDETQAKAILDIKLARLAHLEVNKLEKEKGELEAERDRIEEILGDEELFKGEIKKGWHEVAERFGDERRTKILDISKDDEEPTEVRSLQLSLTNKNNIFVSEVSSLYTQRRGGVGNKLKMEKDEYVLTTCAIESNEEVMFFTQRGDCYHHSAANLPVGERIAVEAIIPLQANDQIKTMAALNKKNPNKYIIFFTKKGMIKKSSIEDYNLKRSGSLKAINLDSGDEVVDILFMNEEKVGILAASGNFLVVETCDVRPIGRVAKGVKGIKLNEGDYVVGARAIENSTTEIVSVSTMGYCKKTSIKEFSSQGKNTKGAKIQSLKDGDSMADFLPVGADDKELLVASTGSCIKFSLFDVPTYGRGAQGTKSIKLGSRDEVLALEKF